MAAVQFELLVTLLDERTGNEFVRKSVRRGRQNGEGLKNGRIIREFTDIQKRNKDVDEMM
jgi:hypothetical protein